MDTKTQANKVSKVNRVALLGISGAMSTTATAALEMILDVMPLELYIKQTAKITLTRLNQMGSLHPRSVRHMKLTRNSEINTNTDYAIPFNVIGSNFVTLIPSAEEWELNRIALADICIYTDGSKLATGTGSGFRCSELDFNESYRLRNECSIFQAEIYAIVKAAEKIAMLPIYRSNIGFYIDSQAALMALSSNIIRSSLVKRCHRELSVLSEQHNITLNWVPSHKGIHGNEKADALAKAGANLTQDREATDVFPPLSLMAQQIKSTMKEKWYKRWYTTDSCLQTKLIWNQYISRNSILLLEMDRRQLRMVINLTTGHNTLGKHMVKIGVSNDDNCRWCMDATEDTFHFLCECPALAFRRYTIFNSYFFQALSELRGVDPRKLLAFIVISRWKA